MFAEFIAEDIEKWGKDAGAALGMMLSGFFKLLWCLFLLAIFPLYLILMGLAAIL